MRAGRCRNVLVVAGENRLTGQSRDQSIQTLARVGEPEMEVPNGASVPAYYALLASRYPAETGMAADDLSGFAVLMREHAAGHPDAHLREPLTLAEARAARAIATPLRLSDCCPISDGAVAVVVSAEPGAGRPVRLAGAGRRTATSTCAPSAACSTPARPRPPGARWPRPAAAWRSSTARHLRLLHHYAGAAAGGDRPGAARAAARLQAGDFGRDGALPLNTHGGLLAFGHSGVAGGLMHLAEAGRQLAGRAGARQLARRERALFHADGGVLSAHVSPVLEAA